jgi:Xaa-Pro dipeptidase
MTEADVPMSSLSAPRQAERLPTMSTQHLQFPQPTLRERDLRWSRVRSAMAEWDLAALVVPQHSGQSNDFQAAARYLSNCGGGADADISVVFPAVGEVTVAATDAVERWGAVQNWVTDLREARYDYGAVVVERLRELGVRGERIGVTGLGPGSRTPEGTVLYSTVLRLQREFPEATLVDATRLVDDVRHVKSLEELAFLAKSTALVDAGYWQLRESATAGEYDYAVWADVRAAMLVRGSETTLHSNWVSGRRPPRTLTRPSHRRLERGDVILSEVEASWAGYRAQGVQPVCVGDCDRTYLELLRVQGEVHDRLLTMLRPGTTVAELVDACDRFCKEASPQSGPAAGARASLTMHGRGLGDDGPIVTPNDKPPRELRRALEENMVFVFKPQVSNAEGTHRINWGDSVVVKPNGGVRLGSREFGMWFAE